MNIKAHTKSGVKWTTTSTAVTATSQLLKIAILTRFLEKTDFGLFAIVMFVLGLCNLFSDMGLTSAILHHQNITKKEYSSLYWLNFIFSFVLFLLIWVLSPIVAEFYNESKLLNLLPIVGTSLLIFAIGRQFKTVCYKKLKFKIVSIIEIIAEVCSLILAIVLSIYHWGVYALVYAMLLQSFIANLLLFIMVGCSSENRVSFHFKFKETTPFLKIGFYQVGGQVINYFNGDFDILIIGRLLGAEVLGGYSLAKQLVSRPTGLINPILTKVASPILATLQTDLFRLKDNYLKLVSVVSSINLIVYIIIFVFASPIVHVLYGLEYDNIIIIVRILSGYMFIRSIGNPIGSLLIALGRTDLDFKWNLVVLLVMPFCIWFGSQYGVVYVATFEVLLFLLLFPLSWRMLISNTIKASFKEYIYAICDVTLLFRLLKSQNK